MGARRRKKRRAKPTDTSRSPTRTIGSLLTGLRPHLDYIIAAFVALGFVAHLFATDEYFLGSGSDIVSLQHPFHVFATSWMARGILPLWNPFILGGVPFQAGVHGYLYPGWWTGVLLPAGFDIKLGIALHLMLAATGGVYFARRRLEQPVARCFFGVALALSGFMIMHLFAGHRVLVATTAYLPWVAGALDRWLSGERRALFAGVVASGLMMLCGHYQMIAIGLGGLVLFLLLERAIRPLTDGSGVAERVRGAASVVAGWSILVVLGALIAAVQLAPMAATLELSQRATRDAAFAASFSSAPVNLLTYLWPHLFGNKVDALFAGNWSYWESLGYLGLAPLFLAPIGTLAIGWRRALPAVLLCAIGLVLTLGAHTPFFAIYLKIVPGAELFRSPGRFCFLVTMFGALLAGHGLDALINSSRRRGHQLSAFVVTLGLTLGVVIGAGVINSADGETFRQWVQSVAESRQHASFTDKQWTQLANLAQSEAVRAAVVSACLAILVLAGVKRPEKAGVVAVLITLLFIVDLGLFGHRFLRTGPRMRFHWPDRLTELIHEEEGPAPRLIPPPRVHWPNHGAMVEIGALGGYDIFIDHHHARYLNRSQGRALDRFFAFARLRRGSPLIRHLGARFLVTTAPLNNGRNRMMRGYDWFDPYLRLGSLYLYRDEEAPPRAALVHRVEQIEDELQVYQRMEQPDFSIKHLAITEAPLPEGFALPKPLKPGAAEEVTITAYEPNRVAFDTKASTAAILVLSDNYHPGWRATVDGQPVPVVRANRVMRAVPVPAGEHRVEMRYLPTSFVVGAIVSLLALLGLIGGYIVVRGRARGASIQ